MNTAKTKPVDHDEITGEVIESNLPAVMETGIVATITRAELDTQIATAKQYPRSIRTARDNILSLVTMDEQTAEDCIYSMPRAGKPIQGMGIRGSEIIFQSWGNGRVEARVVAVDRANKVVVAQATFHDLETNSAVRAEVRRRISDKRGRIFSDDMITVTGNAACSIARRNVILAGVPKAIWRPAYEAALKVVAGDIKTLGERREKAIKAFGAFGVKPEQIFAVLDVESIDEIMLDDIPVLLGMYNAIKNGEATVEEVFDPRRTASATNFDVVSNPLKDEPTPASPKEVSGAAPGSDADDTSGGETGGAPAAVDASASAAPATSSEPAAADENAEHLELVAAFKLGQQAQSAGHARKAIPPEFRHPDKTRAALAWQAGWDGSVMPEFTKKEG